MPWHHVRSARPADLDDLVGLLGALQDHLEQANPAVWRLKDEARAQLKGQVRSRISGSSACALVAEHDIDGIVGVAFGRVVSNDRYLPSRTGMVDQLYVAVSHRRAGVGSSLVAELCHYFARNDVDDLSLRYVAGNHEAESFWAALGFVPRIVTVGASRTTVERQLPQLGHRN